MVPEAKELMIRCWDHNAENRPDFHDCSECTSVMYEAYQKEVRSAVQSVEDRLLNTGSSDQQDEPELDDINRNMDEFLEAPENGGKGPKFQQLDLKAVGEDPKPPTTLETAGETNKDKISSSSGCTMDTFVEVLKNSGGYKKFIGQLNNEGVLSEEDKQKLNSSQNLKDFSDAAKVFGEKLTQNPEHMLPVLKSILNL
ncbi:hypothetical protein AB205_0051120 [Aquarana catesbeiana]|uniref:Uncharacterized protein n=1 Tax=Aquarana catesbeiana TaxID=8400 RepID=A0A2G9RI94_AQUCT|nr:hypothetical protein AB205_0051120 [Aquarana catesbeiana]